MLGDKEPSFYTVKDLSAAEFINAFATYLKKNNLIERPTWADLVKTSTGTFFLIPSQRTRSPWWGLDLPQSCCPRQEDLHQAQDWCQDSFSPLRNEEENQQQTSCPRARQHQDHQMGSPPAWEAKDHQERQEIRCPEDQRQSHLWRRKRNSE